MELKPERSSSHTPLFQVMFVLQSSPGELPKMQNLSTSDLGTQTGAAKFDLLLVVIDTPQGLHTWFEYNTDLFEESTVGRMLGQLQTLIEAACENALTPVLDLPLLKEAEKQQLLQEFSRATSVYPRDRSIHQVFEEQACRTPGSPAVQDGHATLHYAELNAQANQLARYLRAQGVQRDTPVGVYLDRSVDMIVSLLAILKAGGAYLPLDRDYPRERIALMLEDANAPLLITRSTLKASLPPAAAKLICLDTESRAIKQESANNLENVNQPADLAYILYTSGSTGRPKARAFRIALSIGSC
jgi:non-ribosomal peptide synthetase component F